MGSFDGQLVLRNGIPAGHDVTVSRLENNATVDVTGGEVAGTLLIDGGEGTVTGAMVSGTVKLGGTLYSGVATFGNVSGTVVTCLTDLAGTIHITGDVEAGGNLGPAPAHILSQTSS